MDWHVYMATWLWVQKWFIMGIHVSEDRAPRISHDWIEKGEEHMLHHCEDFDRPLGHKKEMKGVFLATTVLAQGKLEHRKGTCTSWMSAESLIWLKVENRTGVFISLWHGVKKFSWIKSFGAHSDQQIFLTVSIEMSLATFNGLDNWYYLPLTSFLPPKFQYQIRNELAKYNRHKRHLERKKYSQLRHHDYQRKTWL